MVVTCVVCKITAKKSALSFHTFPKDEEAKENWKKALGLLSVADSARICSAHFAGTDFEEPLLGSRRKLKKNAVPSLNVDPGLVNETENIRREEEVPGPIVVERAPLKRSHDTGNEEDIPCAKYRRIGDIEIDKVCTSPAEAKLCLEVAFETIQEQRTKIRKLQTANNKLRKSVSDLRALLDELKEKNYLSSEACDILDVSQFTINSS